MIDCPNCGHRIKTEANSDEFEEVWSVCRRGSKKKAWYQYQKAVPFKVGHAELLRAWTAHVKSASAPQYVCHLFRWIRDERWEEQLPVEPKADAQVVGSGGMIFRR